ncbi:hypothetical protein J3E69DRAFT_325105 [Trichoderma sp. SZMC 28015]
MARFGTGPQMQSGEAAAGGFLLCWYCPLIVILYHSSGLHFLTSVLFSAQTDPIVIYCWLFIIGIGVVFCLLSFHVTSFAFIEYPVSLSLIR